jgi:CheY-like chemotaxis protein
MVPRPVNVMVVDDEELTRLQLCRWLGSHPEVGAVLAAEDGADALDQLRAHPGALRRLLVLCDVRMPRMDGPSFLAALRADPLLADLRVVAMSTDESALGEMGQGVVGLLPKGHEPSDFRESVSKLVQAFAHLELR